MKKQVLLYIPIYILSTLLIPINAQTFTNEAINEGIDITYNPFNSTTYFGGGISFVDFNSDGLDDISVSTYLNGDLKFYQNNGTGFTELSTFSILTDNTDEVKQISWIDYDNDGDQDAYIISAQGKSILYRNDGSNTFTDVTSSAGLSSFTNYPAYGVAWADINHDSYLDFYIVFWKLSPTYNNILYKNNGDGTFTDITTSAGVGNMDGISFMPTFIDINNDKYPDLYVVNDKNTGNRLYKNNGDETFTDISVSSGTNLAMGAMGVAVGDYDNNGFLDIYVSNSPTVGNKLLKNNGNETFTDVSISAGVTFNKIGWGVNFVDYDNDGHLDVYAASGMGSTSN